jgi:hypothetical protein
MNTETPDGGEPLPFHFDPILEITGAAVYLRAGDPSWIPVIERALEAGDRVAIGVHRSVLLKRERFKTQKSLRGGRLRRDLERRGIRIAARYAVWPSLDAPRIIYRSRVTGWWLQRAGVIGGGRTGYVQALARSLPLAPIVALAHPCSIWVVDR